MLYKVIIQKTVIGKHRPTERDRLARRRVLVVEAKSKMNAEKIVLESADAKGQDFVGIVGTQIVGDRYAVICA